MKKILTKILFGLFFLGLVFGTLMIDEMAKVSAQVNQKDDVLVREGELDGSVRKTAEGLVLKSGAKSRLVFTVFGNSVFRLFPKSEVKFVADASGDERRVKFELVAGRLWVNTLASRLVTDISTPFSSLVLEPGVSDISYKQAVLIAKAFRHSITVELLGKHLILPEGNFIDLREAKIKTSKSDIPKLLYSKLSKEFPYEPVGILDEWEKQNQEDDTKFFEDLKMGMMESVRDRGPVLSNDEGGAFFKLYDGMKRMNLLLTFDEKKKEDLRTAHAMEYFDSAAYALLVGDGATADTRLQKFRDMALELKNSASWRSAVASRFDEFSFAAPDDVFFNGKESLRNLAFFSPSRRIHESFSDVLDGVVRGDDEESLQASLLALRRFGTMVNSNVESLQAPDLAEEVFFESVFVHELLARNHRFLKEEFLKIPTLLQRAYLRLLSDEGVVNDSKQFFISERLKFIALIFGHLEKGNITFQDGRRSVLALADEIEAMKPEFSDTAVLAYYSEQVEKMSPLFSYLRSSGPVAREGDFTENLEDFKKRQEEFREVSALLASAEGGEDISASRREELAGRVSEDIGGIDVKDIKIILPSADGDSRVKIVAASFERVPFTATYDTEKKIISDLVIREEKIPNAIRLQNFSKFFLIRIGKLALPSGETEESLVEKPSEASVLERVTKTKLLEDLKRFEISVEERYLGFENLKDGVTHVRLATIGEGAEAKVFAFDISQNGSVVSNLKIQTVAGEIAVNDTFSLRELPLKVEQVYQRAVFEKQKEEELVEMMEGGGEE